ncbi:ribosomal RNA small subunit methyltransferase, chloroplastic isoform X2 [Syzygium oleosum]|uniref:ribosomal RNA small subunit methyltransferase, chloroplastic isoform X2 n=1 Tax=Syzygium oleosum TaxID=219896 RepID=UPI0024B898A7|nr:ribosomal RNA small subunit methyltransferase, chloroplastic isoform X2 [Syzygium oleosum]
MAATPTAVAHLLPFQPSLPHPSSSSPRDRTGAGHRREASYIACAKGIRGSPDDYHATLKALNSKGRTPRRSLGQHYMLNNDINEQLANAAGVKEGDVVLEIGPGTGSLTNVLIGAGATVLAIEKDPHMASIVTERFAETNQLKVLREDFVRCHIHSHISSFLASIESDMKPRYAKEETAVRLVASALRTSEYRPINIFVNFYSVPEYKFNVPRTNFFPQPNVDAAVVTFRLKKAADYPPVSSIRSFFSMVNSAFNGKRKMLRKSLQHLCTAVEIEKALEEVGLPATSRPGELTLDDFVKLHNLMVKD